MGNSLRMALAAGVVVACSSGSTHPAPPSPTSPEPIPSGEAVGQVGQVGGELTLPGGEQIDTITYSLSNGTNTYTGSEPVSTARIVSFVISSVAAGTGYTLILNATSADGLYSCTNDPDGVPSNTGITVLNRVTTVVNVNMVCTSAAGSDAGGVLPIVTVSTCPVWNTIVFNRTTSSPSTAATFRTMAARSRRRTPATAERAR